MNRLAVVALILLMPFVAQAQFPKFGLGAELGVPVGDFGTGVGTGIGGAAIVKLGLPIVTIHASADYLAFAEKEVSGTIPLIGTVNTKTSSTMWGINAGVTFTMFPFVYAGGEVGRYSSTTKAEISGFPATETKATKTAFTPIVGVSFLMFDVSARYVIMEKSNFALLRAALFL